MPSVNKAILIFLCLLVATLAGYVVLERVRQEARQETRPEDLLIDFGDLGATNLYGISMTGFVGDSFDPTNSSTFFLHAEDNWVLDSHDGRTYLKCLIGGKVYRLYLEEEPS